MREAYKEYAQTFATRIIESDFVAAHKMLAPWLMQTVTPQQLQALIQKEVQEVAEANELEGELHPSSCEIDFNSSTLKDLKAPISYREARPIPEEINEENYRQWMVIQFQPSKQEQDDLGIDAWLDWWMILVELDGEHRIGFFEIEYPD